MILACLPRNWACHYMVPFFGELGKVIIRAYKIPLVPPLKGGFYNCLSRMVNPPSGVSPEMMGAGNHYVRGGIQGGVETVL